MFTVTTISVFQLISTIAMLTDFSMTLIQYCVVHIRGIEFIIVQLTMIGTYVQKQQVVTKVKQIGIYNHERTL